MYSEKHIFAQMGLDRVLSIEEFQTLVPRPVVDFMMSRNLVLGYLVPMNPHDYKY